MIDIERLSPANYAKHLAGYIKDPSKIHVLTKREYGNAPTRAEIERIMRELYPQEKPVRYEPPFACGHPRDGDNIYENERGHERCLTCLREREAKLEEKARREALRQAELDRERNIRIAFARLEIERSQRDAGVRLFNEIIGEVAEAFQLKVVELKNKCRERHFISARMVAYRILHDRGNSCAQIGRWFGRDHSTVIHALQTFDAKARVYPEIAAAYEALKG